MRKLEIIKVSSVYTPSLKTISKKYCCETCKYDTMDITQCKHPEYGTEAFSKLTEKDCWVKRPVINKNTRTDKTHRIDI